jgi:ornithine decarboxylase
MKSGYTSDRIIYANTMKSVNDITHAPNYGINMTTVDSVEGIEQIADIQWSPKVLVRLAVDDSQSQSPFSIKFGTKQKEWTKIMEAIKYYRVDYGGVSFHVGSQAKPEAFKSAIQTARHFQTVTKQAINIMDIGGGFLPNQSIFKKTAEIIKQEKEVWEREGNAPQKWISEPGRFFSSPLQTLYVPIVFMKENEDNRRYILDDSLYAQFTNIVFDHSKPYWYTLDKDMNIVKREPTNKDALFFGKTCDSADFIAIHKNAPKYKVGDILVFPNMGAYTNATASEFNGFSYVRKLYTDKLLSSESSDISYDDNIIFPMRLESEVKLSISN